jgi:signal transduction histidine kinase
MASSAGATPPGGVEGGAAPSGRARKRKHALLVVDDERAIVDSLTALFRRDYRVLAATSGTEALEILDREPIRLVLSDERMPGMTGTELLVHVREKVPESIRILVTGYADIEAVIRAVNYGQIYGYVTKPWEPAELEMMVRHAARHLEVMDENRRLAAELTEANLGLERKVQERTEDLARSERYLESIIANLQSGLLVCDPAGRVEILNAAAARIMHLGSPAEGRGRLLVESARLQYFQPAVERTIVEGRLEYQELSIPLDDGELQYIGYGTSPILDVGGRTTGVIVIFRDTTEKRKFEEQMVQSEKLAAIGELAGGVAHEINNPLGIILGFTQLLLKAGSPDPAVVQKLKHIENQTLRCKAIVTNLLKFARKPRVEHTMVNLGQVMQETLDLLRRQLELDEIAIDARIDPGPVSIQASEGELQQAFFNLIINAGDAMDRGGRLSVRVWAERDIVCARIADTGSGIPPEVIEKIWNPFFTTKAPGKGTGLGLSITRTLVQKSRGTIDLHSVVGEGTTFTMTFPLADPATAPGVKGGGAAATAAAAAGRLSGLTIMVVDGEERVLSACGEALGRENTVELVSDPTQALARIRERRFDLLLLDLAPPRMHGLDVLRLVRQEKTEDELPIILMTDRPVEELERRKDELEVLAILDKPFTANDLQERLCRAWPAVPRNS